MGKERISSQTETTIQESIDTESRTGEEDMYGVMGRLMKENSKMG